jgi:hypothetical protein
VSATDLRGVLYYISSECTVFSVTIVVLYAEVMVAIINTHKAVIVRRAGEACCQDNCSSVVM